MSSKLKWIGIVVVAIIVILIVVPFLIPINKFKPTIESKASEALGRKVQLGNLSLSLLTGSVGIDDVSVSDDPKFNPGPFLTAKTVKVGVELIPLIFSQQLNVTEITVVNPQVTMLKDPSGRWNFSSIGGASSKTTPKSAPASNSAEALSIGKLRLEDGQITLGNTNSRKRTVYTKVNLTASDVAMKNNFPVLFSMQMPGGGSMRIDGKIGPVDAEDAALTPQNVKLTISGLNLASTGFLDPSLGLGGVADMDANLVSEKGQMATKGQLKLSKAVLVAGGSPAGVPAVVNFDTKYDLVKGTGVLHPSTLNIGNAKSNLSGTYKSEGDAFAVDLKITGDGLPATDLESFLPALGINLPDKSRLSAGTMNTNLHVSGPTDKLVTDGTIGLFNGKLAGFDLGKKLSGIGSLAGIKSGSDLIIEKFTTNLHMATTGLRADNLDAVVPALGSMVGNGTVDAKNNLDFKLVATVNNSVATAAAGSMAGGMGGTMGNVLGGGANCKNGGIKVPLQIHGTTASPQFVPDIGGAAASLLKAEFSCAGSGGAGGLTNAAGALAGGSKGTTTDTINQLGGLLGKKKP
ncbi:MAG TPA: AsmA family protein [Candidatus Acidoferrales bacterium]|jgi:AsmA protein|nr:AsmA family protein [Candidatus Acidoferrales bacterium]